MSAAPTPSQLLARALRAAGVRHAFGMPGGEVLPLLDALRAEGIDFVLVRHEGSAGFMADAAWQLTGAPGLCVATLGPGATNLVSGVAGALLERTPLVAVVGRVADAHRNVYTHQTLDQPALFRPIVKHAVTLTAAAAWREIPLALRHLFDGRPGPVFIELPVDVAETPQAGAWVDRFEPAPAPPAPGAVSAAAAALAGARRPVILLGPADRSLETQAALAPLVARLGAPTLASYRAKGLLDESDPWCAGAFGLSPVVDRAQQALLERADVVLTVGFDAADLRPQWLPGWPPSARLVAVDRAPPLDLLHPVEHLLVGPIPATLAALDAALVPLGARALWTPAELARHRAEIEAPFHDGPDGPAAAIRAIQAAAPPDVITAFDVGAHRITAAHVWRCATPGGLLQSNGLASMGFGLPAAIAARICRPDRPALAITGDMGLWMALGELGVAQERGLDLVVAYLSDESLALIELKQQRMRLPTAGVRFRNPAVEPLAAAFGGKGWRARGPEAIAEAVRGAFAQGGLHLIEIPVDAAAYARQM